MDVCIVATYLQKYDSKDLTSSQNKFVIYKNLLEKLDIKINKFFVLFKKLNNNGHEIIEQNFDLKFFRFCQQFIKF